LRIDQGALWEMFGEHLALLFAGAPKLKTARGRSWLAVLTGEQHPDLNQGVLQANASASDAEDLLAVIADAEVPVVVSVASEVDETAIRPLVGAGLVTAPLAEPLMWCPDRVSASQLSFAVRRAESEADLQTACALCAEGHAIDLAVVSRVLGRDPGQRGQVSTWIAWDESEPVSVVWLTHGDPIGVWEMMTPPRHRRRGAARATLTAALAESWTTSTEGAFLWASPAGRPQYESLGFVAVDEPTVWFSPGQDEAAAAIGQAT
jgi:hypothetical protein